MIVLKIFLSFCLLYQFCDGSKITADGKLRPAAFKIVGALHEKLPNKEVPVTNEFESDSSNQAFSNRNFMNTVGFTYSVGGRQFFYAFNQRDAPNWIIQELLPNGKMGQLTDNGVWGFTYRAAFPFSIDGKQFLYAQSLNNKSWAIQELLPDGKMGAETDSGIWKIGYDIAMPFSIRGKQYFIGIDPYSGDRFIKELLPGGKMGNDTDKIFKNEIEAAFTYDIDDQTFIYAQSDRYWTIHELLPGGKLGLQKTYNRWGNVYEVLFSFSIDGRHFMYGHSIYRRTWFIQELKPGGFMGSEETDSGEWKNAYPISFPFVIDDRVFFYGGQVYGGPWIIQELLPNGKMGTERDSG